jgi:DNA polymerase-3 subunit delta
LLYILWGQDSYSQALALEEIKKAVGEEVAQSAIALDGEHLIPNELANTCATLPFFATKRLIIIRGLTERFETKDRPRAEKKTAKTDETHQAFAAVMNNLPDTTDVVLVEGKLSSGNPLFKEILPKASVKAFPMLRQQEVAGWVQRQVDQQGGAISPEAVQLLAAMVGNNLWAMSSEIVKLVLYKNGQRIEADDVRALTSHVQQDNIFALVDAIVEGKAERAVDALEQFLLRGAAPTYILSMLARQFRFIILVKEMLKSSRPRTDIQNELDLADFALRRTLEQATRYTPNQARLIYKRLLETDLAIKTGGVEPQMALEILVAELSRLAQPAGNRA